MPDLNFWRDAFLRRRFSMPSSLAIVMSFQSGCGNINHGTTDLRMFNQREFHRVSVDSQDENILPISRGGYLRSRYSAVDENHAPIVEKEDTITVTLEHGYIADFNDFGGFTVRDAIGEVAVLANVRELRPGENFDYSTLRGKARVVYFTDGAVRTTFPQKSGVALRGGDGRTTGKKSGRLPRGQHLNFSSIPIVGPLTYGGYPLSIELYAVELDTEESAGYDQLLTGLSEAGQAAYAPASPALAILQELGSQLIQSAGENDIEFQYHVVLWPGGKDDNGAARDPKSHLHHLNIREQTYYLVKRDAPRSLRVRNTGLAGRSPQAGINWDRIRVNPDDGLLWRVDDEGELLHVYSQHTWFSLKIRTGLPAAANDIEQDLYVEFSDFLKRRGDSNFIVNSAPIVERVEALALRNKRREDARKVIQDLSRREYGIVGVEIVLEDALKLLKQAFPSDTATPPLEEGLRDQVVQALRKTVPDTTLGDFFNKERVEKDEKEWGAFRAKFLEAERQRSAGR